MQDDRARRMPRELARQAHQVRGPLRGPRRLRPPERRHHARPELVRRDGCWYVDMTGVADKPALKRLPTSKIIRLFDAQAGAFDEARAKIGRPGYDVERVVRELKKAMSKAARAALQ